MVKQRIWTKSRLLRTSQATEWRSDRWVPTATETSTTTASPSNILLCARATRCVNMAQLSLLYACLWLLLLWRLCWLYTSVVYFTLLFKLQLFLFCSLPLLVVTFIPHLFIYCWLCVFCVSFDSFLVNYSEAHTGSQINGLHLLIGEWADGTGMNHWH